MTVADLDRRARAASARKRATAGGGPHSDRARREGRQFVRDNSLATGSTLVAGVLGLLVQAVSSHALQPAAFGKAFAVYSLFTFVTRPSSAFGRLQAWQTSRDRSTTGTEETADVLLRQQTLWLLGGGTALAIAFTLAGTVVGGYLHVPVSYVAAGAFSIPFLLAVQPLLGVLQGQQRFVPWSYLSVLVNLSRFVLILGLVFPFGAIGFLIGNTAAAAVTCLVCLACVWGSFTAQRGRFRWGPTAPFMIAGLVSTVTMGVFQGTDVIMVEHFFHKVAAGQYSAVTSIGSAVFFASGGVASAVFPMIAGRQARGERTLRIMGGAFGLCFAAGAAGTIGCYLLGHMILVDFAGAKYLPGVHYLALYAIGMGMLAWASVVTNTLQSYNSMAQLWILLPATVLRPLLIVLFHGTLMTVVVVGDVTIGLFTLSLSLMYLRADREVGRRLRAAAPRPAGVLRETPAPPNGQGPATVPNGHGPSSPSPNGQPAAAPSGPATVPNGQGPATVANGQGPAPAAPSRTPTGAGRGAQTPLESSGLPPVPSPAPTGLRPMPIPPPRPTPATPTSPPSPPVTPAAAPPVSAPPASALPPPPVPAVPSAPAVPAAPPVPSARPVPAAPTVPPPAPPPPAAPEAPSGSVAEPPAAPTPPSKTAERWVTVSGRFVLGLPRHGRRVAPAPGPPGTAPPSNGTTPRAAAAQPPAAAATRPAAAVQPATGAVPQAAAPHDSSASVAAPLAPGRRVHRDRTEQAGGA